MPKSFEVVMKPEITKIETRTQRKGATGPKPNHVALTWELRSGGQNNNKSLLKGSPCYETQHLQ